MPLQKVVVVVLGFVDAGLHVVATLLFVAGSGRRMPTLEHRRGGTLDRAGRQQARGGGGRVAVPQ